MLRSGGLLQVTGPTKAALAAGAGQRWVCGLRASPARPERRGGLDRLSIRDRRPIRRRPHPRPSPERARRRPAAAAGVRRPGLAPSAGQPAQVTGFGWRARGTLRALTSLPGCCAGGARGVGVRKQLRLGLSGTVGWAAACACATHCGAAERLPRVTGSTVATQLCTGSREEALQDGGVGA